MKLIISTFLLSITVNAFADLFTVIRDNKVYLCEETNPVIDPGGQLNCVNKAYGGP